MDAKVDTFSAIHTSDRIAFKRCRLKWFFGSPLQMGLVPKSGVNANLWFGTGFHHALEDLHGFQLWETPHKAFEAYVNSCDEDERPPEAEEYLKTACGMLDHYMDWLTVLPQLNVYSPVVDGIQRIGTEVNFQVELPDLSEQFGHRVIYEGTIDSIFVDPATSELWIGEYKTAAIFDIAKLETDDQISAYIWALKKCLPDKTVSGVVYRQFKKKVAAEPTVLQNGELSTNKAQKTTYFKYLKALKKLYPNTLVDNYSANYRVMLQTLAPVNFDGDDYFSNRYVRRSPASTCTQGQKIHLDTLEMLDNPRITTNPTRDCAWDCNFRELCLAIDESVDWKTMAELGYGKKADFAERWQTRLKVPESAARNATLENSLAADVGMIWKEFKKKRGLTLDGTA